MSKLSEIATELDNQAGELGFESYDEAIERGGYTTYFNGTTYVLAKADADEQEAAHEAWLKEREVVVGDLTNLLIHRVFDYDIIERAINFIKEVHD